MMRNKRNIWIMAPLIALLGANTVSANVVEIGSTPAMKLTEKNSNFSVNITIDPLGNAIAGAQHNLLFNGSALAVQNVLAGDLFSGGGNIRYAAECNDESCTASNVSNLFNPGIIDNANGSLRNVWSAMVGPINTTTKGNMSNISMIATKNGTFALNLSNVKIADPSGNYVGNNITIGYVCVSPNYDINCVDHKTNIVDLTILNQNWGRSGALACPQFEGRCKDIVKDVCDCVNTADKLKLQQNFGKPIPP